MNKFWLIFKREYFSRVKKKSFILITLLTPLAIAAFSLVVGYITAVGSKVTLNIVVLDESKIFQQSNPTSGSITYSFSEKDLSTIKASYIDDGYDMLIHIPSVDKLRQKTFNGNYYTNEKHGLSTLETIESKIARAFREEKIKQSNLDQEVLDGLRTDFDLENGKILDNPNEKQAGKLNIIIGTILGGLMGFLMYMVIFIYGGMVMRSVMEEKVNRIVEVMISTVKPFQLMLGKILGVGAVGLTQLAIWLILIPVLMMVVTLFLPGNDPQSMAQMAEGMQQIPTEDFDDFNVASFINEFFNLNWWMILPTFVLFFFGGYLIYSSMFAAIGSSISEDMGEGQQLMMPIVLIVLMAFYMLFPVLNNPNGGLAIFASIFPLFSPIIMPARLAFDPPLWQILISLITLAATVVFFIWLSGRIYRVGILMYGKKASLKEIGKWMFYK
jgi:ABC-2 type transport system permease protein